MITAVGVAAFPAQRVAAQVAGAAPVRLWVDQRTGQVFVRPGSGRVPLSLTTADESTIEQQVEQKVQARTDAQIKAQVQQSAAQLQEQNQVLARQVTEMQPAWKSYLDNFQDKFRLGTVIYGDYRFYTNTGFQPSEQENLTNPGPGNNKYNKHNNPATDYNNPDNHDTRQCSQYCKDHLLHSKCSSFPLHSDPLFVHFPCNQAVELAL